MPDLSHGGGRRAGPDARLTPLRMTCGTCGAEGAIGHSIVHDAGCEFYQPPLPPPVPMTWPGTVEPRCPAVCCFRLTCSTATQLGVLPLWAEGRSTMPEQCTV